ncbi:MAG: hypothetical protein RIQ93_3250, partial [Verrucomicrobiota bacterium]|jgi:tetratricopeptide (TPR) repeat protein
LLRVEERLDARRVELTHDVLGPVVKASRDARQERESKLVVERQLAATRANELETRRALWRARVIASACAVAALAAIGSAIFGYRSRQRAVAAEQQATTEAANAVTARRLADTGRAQAQAVMDYMLTDLREQLTDLGQPGLLTEVSQKTVDYYNGLPPELMSVETQVSKANALANLGEVQAYRGDLQDAKARLEEAIGLLEPLNHAGKLNLANQIDYAAALRKLTRYVFTSARFAESVRLCERAEHLLESAVANEATRGPALRELARVLNAKGSALRFVRPAEVASAQQRAITAADEADRLPPKARRPGFQAAQYFSRLSRALVSTRPEEARAATEEGRSRLARFIREEPSLHSARVEMTRVLGDIAADQAAEWNFAAAERTRNEQVELFAEILRVDPKNRMMRNNRAVLDIRRAGDPANTGEVQDLNLWDGNFAGVERVLQDAVTGFSFEEAGNFEKANRAAAHGRLAVLNAATGRDREADEELARMHALTKDLPA